MAVWKTDEEGDIYKAPSAFVIRSKQQNASGNWQYQLNEISGEKHNGNEWVAEILLSSR
jgi:hypothetical protein